MRMVFLDTVGLIALWDRSDQWHAAADAAYQMLQAGPIRLATSTLILFECGNAAARRTYRKDVVDLWSALNATGDLLHPSEDQIRRAWASYAIAYPGSAGVVDDVSFVLMADAGITEVFSNDAHFRSAGFTTLF